MSNQNVFTNEKLDLYIDKNSLSDEQKRQGIGMVCLMLDVFQQSNINDAGFAKCYFSELKDVTIRTFNFILATFDNASTIVTNIIKRYGLMNESKYHTFGELEILNKVTRQRVYDMFKSYWKYIRKLYFVSDLLYPSNPITADGASLDFLHLPTKTISNLSNAGINTLGDLLSHTYIEFKSLYLTSNHVLEKITSRLGALNYSFKTDYSNDNFNGKNSEFDDMCEKLKKYLYSSVKILGLSKYALNALKRCNINNIYELLKSSLDNYKKLDNVSSTVFKEIIRKLKGLEEFASGYVPPANAEIDSLPLAPRTLQLLKNAGIMAIAELINLTYEELHAIPFIHVTTIKEIIFFLNRYGYDLKVS